MTAISPLRRSLLAAMAGSGLLPLAFSHAAEDTDCKLVYKLEALEKSLDGRLGVWMLNTGNAQVFRYRANERFPFCSTFKLMLCGAVMAKAENLNALLAKPIPVRKEDLVSYSPVTEKQVGKSMTVGELCAAALQYSDNTAANLLIREVGGVAAVTAFARSRGDSDFRLDRMETELNTAIPGDLRDTSTPEAMGRALLALTLGDAVSAAASVQMSNWLKGNTTGNARIRAALPAGWQCGDKTGTGDYGTANDIAVIWPDDGKQSGNPIILSIYTTRKEAKAEARSDLIAEVARLVLSELVTDLYRKF